MDFFLHSSAFQDNTAIPKSFTCDGTNLSPPLNWENAPPETQSFVLIMDDPDAPNGTWVHWVLFNIPSNETQLAGGIGQPANSMSGVNSWGTTGYGGPCPPSGIHRYVFKLYALNTRLTLDATADKEAVLNAMEEHILAGAELIGLYQRTK